VRGWGLAVHRRRLSRCADRRARGYDALREALDAIEEWRAAAYVTQAEERIASLIAHCLPPVA